ncbi:unnamed protein product [Amoebophrya sp. A120]|nr:unnamed protein product [Amoebophrya sp. A120]|eukprot:GSA120T00010327001.1
MSSLKDLPSLNAPGRRRSGFDLDPSIFDTDEPKSSAAGNKKSRDPLGGGDALDNFLPFGERPPTAEEEELEAELARQNEILKGELNRKEQETLLTDTTLLSRKNASTIVDGVVSPDILDSTGILGNNRTLPQDEDTEIDDILGDILEDDQEAKAKLLKRSQTEPPALQSAATKRNNIAAKEADLITSTSERSAAVVAVPGSSAAAGSSSAGGINLGFSLKESSGSGLSTAKDADAKQKQKEATPPPMGAKRRGGFQTKPSLVSEDSDDDLFLPMGPKEDKKTANVENKDKTIVPTAAESTNNQALFSAAELGFSDSDNNGPDSVVTKKDQAGPLSASALAAGNNAASTASTTGPRTRRNLGLRLNFDNPAPSGTKNTTDSSGTGSGTITGAAGAANKQADTSSSSKQDTYDEDDDLPIFGAAVNKKRTLDDMAIPSPKNQKVVNPQFASLTTNFNNEENSVQSARGESPLQKARDLQSSKEADIFAPGDDFLKKPPRRPRGEQVGGSLLNFQTRTNYPAQAGGGQSNTATSSGNEGGSAQSHTTTPGAAAGVVNLQQMPGGAGGLSAQNGQGGTNNSNSNSNNLLSTSMLSATTVANPGSTANSVRPSRRQSAEQAAALGIGNNIGSAVPQGANLVVQPGGAPGTTTPMVIQAGATAQFGGATAAALLSSNNPQTAFTLKQAEEYARNLDEQTNTIKQLKLDLVQANAELQEQSLKAKRLENEITEQDLKQKQQKEKQKLELESERERFDLEKKRLENELDRVKTVHAEEIRHLQESKRMLTESLDLEKEQCRRDEQRKGREECERLKRQFLDDQGENEKRHQRQVQIIRESTEKEIETIRNSASSGVQINSLLERVHDTTFQMDLLQKKIESQRSAEDQLREQGLDNREKMIRATEKQLQEQSKEVETQRKKMTDLINRMEAELAQQQLHANEHATVASERLEREHARLLEMQRSLKEERAKQYEETKVERLRLEEKEVLLNQKLQQQTEEFEQKHRAVTEKEERVKKLENAIESSKLNCERRIKESEVLISSERKNLLLELERFEEKKRDFVLKEEQFKQAQGKLEGEKMKFEEDVARVKELAEKAENRRKQVEKMYLEGCEMREEAKQVHGKIVQDRALRDGEIGRLKALQQMIERQRLELVQDASVRVAGGNPSSLQPGGGGGGGHGHAPSRLMMSQHQQMTPGLVMQQHQMPFHSTAGSLSGGGVNGLANDLLSSPQLHFGPFPTAGTSSNGGGGGSSSSTHGRTMNQVVPPIKSALPNSSSQKETLQLVSGIHPPSSGRSPAGSSVLGAQKHLISIAENELNNVDHGGEQGVDHDFAEGAEPRIDSMLGSYKSTTGAAVVGAPPMMASNDVEGGLNNNQTISPEDVEMQMPLLASTNAGATAGVPLTGSYQFTKYHNAATAVSSSSSAADTLYTNALGAYDRTTLQQQLQKWTSTSDDVRAQMKQASKHILGVSANGGILTDQQSALEQDRNNLSRSIVLETSRLGVVGNKTPIRTGSKNEIGASIENNNKSFISLDNEDADVERGRALLNSVGGGGRNANDQSWNSLHDGSMANYANTGTV